MTTVRLPRIARLHLAKNPSVPRYGIIAEYADGRELWDADCASGSVAATLAAARRLYPRRSVLMPTDAEHYSHRSR